MSSGLTAYQDLGSRAQISDVCLNFPSFLIAGHPHYHILQMLPLFSCFLYIFRINEMYQVFKIMVYGGILCGTLASFSCIGYFELLLNNYCLASRESQTLI